MRVRLLSHFDDGSHNEKLLLLLGIVAAYMIMFKPIYLVVGEAADVLYFVPVAMAGWLLGTRSGLLFGFLSIPVNALLFSQFQEITLIYLMPLYPMHLFAIIVGSLTGQFKNLLDHAKNQTRKLEQEEKGHLEEIAERVRLEDELRKSEEKYRQLVENANEMIIVAQDGVLKFFNHKLVELSGYTKEELSFMPFSQLIHPEDQGIVVENHLKRLRNENLPEIYDFRTIDKHGNLKWVEINSVTIDWQGQPATLNFLSDISERKKAEEAYRAIVDHSLQGLMIVQDSRIVFSNQALANIVGYSVEEMLAGSKEIVMDSVHHEDRKLVWSRYFDRLSGKSIPEQYELRVIRKDGTSVWLEMHATQIKFMERPAVQAAVLDITERKKVEEEVKTLNSELESRVIERTAQLEVANKDLQAEIAERVVAQDRLSRLNECLLSFGTDATENINSLIALFGNLLQGDCAIYSRFDGEKFNIVGRWNVPPDFVPADRLEDQMCYELVQRQGDKFLFIRNLDQTRYALANPDLLRFGIKTYLGRTTTFDGVHVGSLCVLYRGDRSPTDEDKKYMDIIASAIGVEEERRQAIEKMQESEARFRRLAENAPDIISRLALNPKPHIVYISQAVESILDYSPEDFYSKPELALDFIHPNDLHLFESIIWGEVPSSTPITLRLLSKDGRCIWAEQRSVPIYAESGKLEAIESVTRDVTDRVLTESQLKSSLEEKEVLLKEVHHRVKNNLQVISSLLNLQSSYVDDPHTRELFKESQNRVKSMAMIHERLYRSDDLMRIDFAEYIRGLVSDLFISYKSKSDGVQLRINVVESSIGIDAAIPCGLIVNELVSNALKHAFPNGRKGEIHIDFNRDDEGFNLVVGDNGVGFPVGLDFRKTESLGLQLVNTLTDQIGGTIELDSSSGTEFRIASSEI